MRAPRGIPTRTLSMTTTAPVHAPKVIAINAVRIMIEFGSVQRTGSLPQARRSTCNGPCPVAHDPNWPRRRSRIDRAAMSVTSR
jgi:hypothetical protein